MKLSDALRGAADRAPLDGLSVDTGRARRRAATHRGLRGGAGGVLAGGMVVVLGFGISGAVGDTFTSASMDDAAGEESAAVAEDAREGAMGGAADGGAIAGSSGLAWGLCGESLPDLDASGAPLTLATVVTNEPGTGDDLAFTVTATAVADGTFETFGIGGVILWDGIVVGTVSTGTDGEAVMASVVDLAVGTEEATDLAVPLVNCWDGEALPAADYDLVVTQELWEVAPVDEPVAPPVEEPVAPTTEPTASSAVEPTVDPDTSVSSDGTDGTDGAVAGSGIASGGSTARALAEPVAFSIAGDAIDDPFAQYLGGDDPKPRPTTPDGEPTVNEDALDADTARALYQAGLAGAWDMAAGSQRWLVSSDSLGTVDAGWYGCAWEGDGSFPARSAQMDLLDITVDAPAAIDVSYGWVVEGNPVVTNRVTNASQWDLDGFWDASSVQFALVRDGKVVAEAYPVNPVQSGGVSIAEPAMTDDAAGMTVAPYPYGEGGLARGASVSTDLLWRDVNGCWGESGQIEVEPGTYTLLAMHYLSVGGETVWMGGAEEGALEGKPDASGLTEDDEPALVTPDSALAREAQAAEATLGGASGSEGSGDAAIAPAPDSYDAVDFQVWTSLGAVTVG